MAEITNPTQLLERQLQCSFVLQSGTFQQGFNTKIVNDSTINAIVTKTLNNNFTNSANITVYGMNPSDIAALSTLGYAPLKYEANHITLNAQYSNGIPTVCFSGYIIKAWADFSDPSRPMHFECQETYQDSIKTTAPINIQGSASIPSIFSILASGMSLSFQNNGVTGMINNPILTGSSIDQLKQLSKQTNTNCIVDNGALKIAPKTYSLTTTVLDINSESGLISYPIIDVWGVKFRIRYNPTLQLGQYIALKTIVPLLNANGQWYVYDMQHSLNNRHENWYTDLKCSSNNVQFG